MRLPCMKLTQVIAADDQEESPLPMPLPNLFQCVNGVGDSSSPDFHYRYAATVLLLQR